jgi:hypothetical protein
MSARRSNVNVLYVRSLNEFLVQFQGSKIRLLADQINHIRGPESSTRVAVHTRQATAGVVAEVHDEIRNMW